MERPAALLKSTNYLKKLGRAATVCAGGVFTDPQGLKRYKYINANTQIQIHKHKNTNANTHMLIHQVRVCCENCGQVEEGV